ncbi:hypothetical protein BDV37DRAFT_257461 [Aspergillus pseudonomiae]|uniref:Uncharacterized protein n=1 Tax=Aspergillus pseudonomiae TaxID=1506151 RepID=A0A5N7D2C6_9EURO|nr:uncharacterized protein BDV37DRAFT_257461 [Aspergillus pseudonomiae]KAE8400561.1 hypothetical protein BDV37DRAFT_257461 [Aspergillus pseudonomiae]
MSVRSCPKRGHSVMMCWGFWLPSPHPHLASWQTLMLVRYWFSPIRPVRSCMRTEEAALRSPFQYRRTCGPGARIRRFNT